jgi:hypothetical protein
MKSNSKRGTLMHDASFEPFAFVAIFFATKAPGRKEQSLMVKAKNLNETSCQG